MRLWPQRGAKAGPGDENIERFAVIAREAMTADADLGPFENDVHMCSVVALQFQPQEGVLRSTGAAGASVGSGSVLAGSCTSRRVRTVAGFRGLENMLLAVINTLSPAASARSLPQVGAGPALAATSCKTAQNDGW